MGVPSQAAGVAALLLSSGCVDTFQFAPVQLQYLNGYSIHGEQTMNGATYTELPYRLVSTQGQPVDYNSSKELILLGASQQPLAPPGPFDVIVINDETFDAVPLTGPPVQVPLKDIKSVEIREPNPQKTNDLVIAISTIVSLILTGVVLAASH